MTSRTFASNHSVNELSSHESPVTQWLTPEAGAEPGNFDLVGGGGGGGVQTLAQK